MKVYEYSYTFSDLTKIASTPPKEGWKKVNHSVNNDPSREWDLSVGYDGAVKLLHHGWPEGTEQIAAYDIQRSADRSTLHTSVYGLRVLVPAFVAGDPVCMLMPVRSGRKVRNITLNIPCGYPYYIDSSQVIEYGQAICASIDALEEAGYRCQIIGDITSSGKDDSLYRANIEIKDFDQGLDRDAIAFYFCHPAFLRRIMFRAKEIHKELYEGYHGNYGSNLSSNRAYYYTHNQPDGIVFPPIQEIDGSINDKIQNLITEYLTNL